MAVPPRGRAPSVWKIVFAVPAVEAADLHDPWPCKSVAQAMKAQILHPSPGQLLGLCVGTCAVLVGVALDHVHLPRLVAGTAYPHLIAARAGGEVCVCELTDAFELTGPTISHHHKVLREAGLVDCQRRGTWVYYSLVPGRLGALSRLLDTSAMTSGLAG